MKAKAVWIAGVTGLALLSAYGVIHILPGVESDVRARVAKALADNGLDDVRAKVSGQNVTLSVGDTVTNPDEHLKQAQEAVSGIRDPNNLPTVAAITLVNNAPVVQALPAAAAAPATASVEAVSGEKATTVAPQGVRPAVAGDDAQDASTVAARSCQDQVDQAMGGRKLSYVFGTYDLTNDSQPVLDDVYKVVSACPDTVRITISGFTDNVGDATANRLISQARAQTAADALVTRGIRADRIKVLGYGPAEPVADNATPEGRAENRRVVIEISAS
jgi:outer membrane protein OmpA-like peptidoglycan-associated protein